MRCVITNDDGIDAPGLGALHRALRELAQEVIVVAPAASCSGVGHGAPPGEPITVETRTDPVFGRAYAVHAKPADCARLALLELVSPRPDLVVSGINRGANVGVDVYYSGTVAAAREAAILGVPAIAVSQFIREEIDEDWDVVARRTAAVLRRLLAIRHPLGLSVLWNVNLPHVPPGVSPKGVAQVPAAVAPTDLRFDATPGENGRSVYRYVGRFTEREAPSGTDVAYLFDDWVTLTPLRLDTTGAGLRREELDWKLD